MRNATFVGCMFFAFGASGCSLIDDFGAFTVAPDDASFDAGVRDDLGTDAGRPDLGPWVPGPLGAVVDLQAGSAFNCALFESGQMRCWGSNAFGALGNGDTSATPPPNQATPGDVVGLPGPVVQFSAAHGHVCAVVDDRWTRALYCWGDRTYGQLGTGVTTNVAISTPQRIDAPWVPRAVAAGGDFTCVITTDNRVLCAGANTNMQLGVPYDTAASSPSFIEAAATASVTDTSTIVAGNQNACLLSVGSEALCWGDGSEGQIPTPSGNDTSSPIGVGAFEQVTIGYLHMCGVEPATGKILCWGYGTSGQLGDGAAMSSNSPVEAAAPPDPGGGFLAGISVKAGSNHNCAMYARAGMDTGDVFCWGSTDSGAIGSTSGAYQTLPAQVVGLPNVAQVATGDVHTCVRMGGQVFCWGSNYNLQLGPGASGDTLTPTQITGLD
jgi:alpha-tubulin suppressor-like RCC1 family protein